MSNPNPTESGGSNVSNLSGSQPGEMKPEVVSAEEISSKPDSNQSKVPEAVAVPSSIGQLQGRRSSQKSQRRSRKRNWEEWQTGRETLGFLRYTFTNSLILGAAFLASYLFAGTYFHSFVESVPELGLGSKVNMVLVTALLIGDSLLPLEVSQLCMLSVESFGKLKGLVICVVGMTGSSAVLFLLANKFVPPVLRSLVSEKSLQRKRRQVRKWGPWAIILTRGVPILSEMTSFYVGCHRMNWFQFGLSTVSSAFGIALYFVVFKEIAPLYFYLIPLVSLWGGLVGIFLLTFEDLWLPWFTGDFKTDAAGRRRKKRRKKRSRSVSI